VFFAPPGFAGGLKLAVAGQKASIRAEELVRKAPEPLGCSVITCLKMADRAPVVVGLSCKPALAPTCRLAKGRELATKLRALIAKLARFAWH